MLQKDDFLALHVFSGLLVAVINVFSFSNVGSVAALPYL
jgi:hypothetical protein